MRYKYACAVLFALVISLASVYGSPVTFTINLDNPPSGPSITGGGWTLCAASGTGCGGYCADTSHPYNSASWESGHSFTAPFEGDYRCTLTVKATSYSIDSANMGQSQEWVQGKVNDVEYTHTPDVCTNDVTCGCDIGQITETKTVHLYATGNVVTVRRGWNSVDIKGGYLTCTGERVCDEEWLDEYRCQGKWSQRLWVERDCDEVWKNYEYCDYGCVDGECLPGCDPGYTNNTRCNGNWLQREYQNYDCSTEWRNYQYCSYGCSGGDCNPGPNPYCTDTDGGIIYATQGNTYGVDDTFATYSKSDYCSGNTLYEYYCAATGHTWAVTSITCTGLCVDGECVPDNGCDDECSMYGYQECYGSGGYRICGYYDTDVCLDWSYHSCGPCEECFNGYCTDEPDCDDDCDSGYEDDYQCDGNWVQRLYIYSDCDEEWRDYEYCSEGCDDGECEDDDCDPGYQNDYQCNGNWLQRLYTDSDCDDEWRDYQYCSYGCSNDQCNQQPCPNCCGCQTCPCPQEYCGNGVCGTGETCSNCPTDCGQCNYCGNGVCNSGETCSTCPTDCGQCNYCGNGVCNTGETCSSCPIDCGNCNYCGNGICGSGETCSNCPADCGQCSYCGNGICNTGETCTGCPIDCGQCGTCGNGICNAGETCSSCPIDCGQCSTCGNGVCSTGETCSSCPADCGQCSTCGDGTCSSGENCASCSTDCGICDNCGDGVCTGSESCGNCATDCGNCINVCGVEIGENVEVTAEACIEFEGSGTNEFVLTLYNREDHTVLYGIDLLGEANEWAEVDPTSLRVDAYESDEATITVTVPEGVEQGLYNLSARISSGGEVITTKQLYVSVAEAEEPGAQPVAVIIEQPTPTGGVIIGGVDVIWLLIGAAVVVNVILLFILLRKVQA